MTICPKIDQTFNMDWYTLAIDVLEKSKLEKEAEILLSESSTEGNSGKAEAEEKEEENWQLTPLEAACVSLLLQTASLQLFIIDVGTCDTSSQYSNSLARQAIADVLQKTEEEISSTRTFRVLCEKTKEETKTKLDSKLIPETLAKNEMRVLELKSKLSGHELKKTKELNKKQEVIAFLKDKIHEEVTKGDFKLRFVDKWETARQNQHVIKCRQAESLWHQKLGRIKSKINNEIRVHHEITTFLSLENERLLQEVERWKTYHADEMKKRTEKIKKLERKREEQQIHLKNLKQLYEEHKKEINDYLEFKAKIQAEQERQRFINEMAVKIQAWWRGTMVRRGLGAFKKKKKPTKDKKSKKN